MTRHLGAILLVIALAAFAAAGAARFSGPRTVARVGGQVTEPPTGGDGWVAWVEGEEGEARLVAVRRGGKPRAVMSAESLSGLAISGGSAYLASEGEAGGGDGPRLLRVDLGSGDVGPVATLARPAVQIAVGEGWVCWRETTEDALAGVPFVVAAAPLDVVHVCREDGGDASLLAAAERGPEGSGLELLGMSGGHIYWVERAAAGPETRTLVRRITPGGGAAETLIEEPGRRTVALGDGALLWTAPSPEAAEAAHTACVKRLTLGEPEAEVVGEWLSPSAVVMASGGRAYAQEQTRLWVLSAERWRQRVIREGPSLVRAASVVGDEQYLVIRATGRSEVAKRGLTWWAQLRTLIGR